MAGTKHLWVWWGWGLRITKIRSGSRGKSSEQAIVLLMSILMASGLMRLVASGSGLMGHKNQENIRVTNPQKTNEGVKLHSSVKREEADK